jgi:Cu(I)/Ag(I) efflux system membrane protein CusA/SilA
VAVILAGLFPILLTGGAGAEVMRRIAAPLVGGMLTAPLLSLFVIPAAYLMIRRRGVERGALAVYKVRIANQRGS